MEPGSSALTGGCVEGDGRFVPLSKLASLGRQRPPTRSNLGPSPDSCCFWSTFYTSPCLMCQYFSVYIIEIWTFKQFKNF